MLKIARNHATLHPVSPWNVSPFNTLCSATFNSERFWCETNSIHLPSIADPAQDRIVFTLDELLFPFCPEEKDILLTHQALPSSQLDYLHSLGFGFQNRVIDYQISWHHHVFKGERQYYFSPYAVLPDWEKMVAQWSPVNDLPPLQTVKKVNSKIYSWQLRCEITGKLGEACFSSAEVGAAAGEILDHGRKAIVKEAFGVSGHGSVLIDGRKALERIYRYIENRERRGGTAEFVVEPLLPKTDDFSCHFSVSNTGELNLYGLQRMRNKGFGFSKIELAEQSLFDLLEKNGYWRVVEEVAKALFKEGYFGPVCLDSMLTSDGMTPVVEINARKSMGLINLCFNAQLGNPSGRCILGFYNLRVPESFSHQKLLHSLDEHGILLSRTNGRGVALLNAGGITANLSAAPLSVPSEESPLPDIPGRAAGEGRVYFSILSSTAADEMEIEEDLKKVLHELEIKLY